LQLAPALAAAAAALAAQVAAATAAKAKAAVTAAATISTTVAYPAACKSISRVQMQMHLHRSVRLQFWAREARDHRRRPIRRHPHRRPQQG